MGLRRMILGAVIVGMALVPSTAIAGGWWNGLDLVGQVVGVGESFSFSSEVLFPDVESAEAANSSDFRAYLVRGMDKERLERATGRAEPGDWWAVPEEMIEVGTVSFSKRDANLATATAHLHVADVPPGSYNLMLCNPGCVEPVGNLFPLRVRVSSDPLMAEKVRRLTQQKWDMRETVAGVKHDLRRAKQKLLGAELTSESEDRTETEPHPTAAASARETTTTWWQPGMWFAGGALLTLVLTRFRRTRRTTSAALDVPT